MKRFGLHWSFLTLAIVSSARAQVCVGCSQTVDPNDIDALSILIQGVAILNTQETGSEDITVTSVNNVTSQVVSGVKYTYDYIGEGQQSKNQYSCQSVILHQPWAEPQPQVLHHKCDLKNSRRSAL